MYLLFKQRLFSWFDSYDVFDRNGETLFTVKGQLAWGHCLKIYNRNNVEIATVKERIFTFLPKFELFEGERYIGCISKEFTFFRPKFNIDFNGWHIEGDLLEWDYSILNSKNTEIATVSKRIWNLTDTYEIFVENPDDALYALMLVLAIDAEKCSRND